jgi:hypothetical protein
MRKEDLLVNIQPTLPLTANSNTDLVDRLR